MLVNLELLSKEPISDQISYLIKGINNIDLNEREEQALLLHPDPVNTLMERKKKQHLNYEKRLHIIKEMHLSNIDKREISSKYKLSDSTIRNILREFGMQFSISKLQDLKRSSKIMHSTVVRKSINNFYKQ